MLNGRASRETYSSIGILWLVGWLVSWRQPLKEKTNRYVLEKKKERQKKHQDNLVVCALSVGTSRTKYNTGDEGL